ncbi:hypothetical protein ALI144C_15175 [Actinosynnema sp. ALI-1.44]|uniref:hypothetical protein n=1 Tax=Actinosynnema sp. ALI-1.44 TaxID=1933779 RepID=UPI00097C9670|nr:hypothetical protein [Actinosynnema sp. ALI-1.44]ONI84487.1 hypothetical protein ALI144C_15175 [Actinosynnema sp. ALI-1.44]
MTTDDEGRLRELAERVTAAVYEVGLPVMSPVGDAVADEGAVAVDVRDSGVHLSWHHPVSDDVRRDDEVRAAMRQALSRIVREFGFTADPHADGVEVRDPA